MISTDDYREFPDWHREVLEERERLIASGEAQFIPWEQAKAEIRKLVSQAGGNADGGPIFLAERRGEFAAWQIKTRTV